MQSVLVVLFLLVSIAMVALILLQHGKGADAGAAFGSGASATVFGAQGSANFLSRTTAILAATWFVIAMALGWYALQGSDRPSLMDDVPAQIELPQESAAPTELPDVPEAQVREAVSDLPDIPSVETPAADAAGAAETTPAADASGKPGDGKQGVE